MKTKVLVAGAGGFIGGHLVGSLIRRGFDVRAVDIKPLEEWYQVHRPADNVFSCDLKNKDNAYNSVNGCVEVYNLAADMGGMGFIENNKALCMLSVLINTHLLMAAKEFGVKKYFYASSACVYNASKQLETEVSLKEEDAYPAMPEDGYGWEKLFSERMCRHFHEDFGLDVRIARFHNVYGPHGTWDGGREKAPAAICRKVITARLSGNHTINIWGDGEQTRSFMYIDDCIEGIERLMESDRTEPINLGRNDLITINQLVTLTESIAGVTLRRSYDLTAPKGVRGRNSDNTLIQQVLGWQPSISMDSGMRKTYAWIEAEIEKK